MCGINASYFWNNYLKKLCLLLLLIPICAQAEDSSVPPKPNNEVPEMSNITTVYNVGSGAYFDPRGHADANKELLKNPYIGELRKALYWQDTAHQFQSKAHFDNCDFDGATAYIEKLLIEVGEHASDAQHAKNFHNDVAANESAALAFFALGQALHATQDFYAHSNYVELKAKDATKLGNIPLIRPWAEDGKQAIKDLLKNGLISGVVFWGFPQTCPNGTPSHKQVAKDSEETKSGKVIISSLNQSEYKIAIYLARETSKELIEYAFSNWPILQEINGPLVAFDTLIDRRGM